MAFPILSGALSASERDEVMSELVIRPVAKDAEELQNLIKMRAPKAPRSHVPKFEIPPFPFVSEDGQVIRVPLFYAKEKFGSDVSLESGSWRKLSRNLRGQKNVVLRDGQAEILDEALSHLKEHNTATLELRAGTGKTILAIMLALELGLKFAILLPFKTLIGQWVASFGRVAYGDGSAGEFAVKSGIVRVPDEQAVEAKRAAKIGHIPGCDAECIIALGERALSISESFRESIGTLIIDEVHKCCVPSWVNTLLSFSPKYVIALSATVERPDGAHRMTHLLAGPHRVYRVPDRPFTVVEYKTGVHIPETLNKYTKLLDYTQYCADLANSPDFLQRILDVVTYNPNRKFIALFKLVRHAEAVRTALSERGIASALMCRQISRYVDCQVLCGTSNKIGTGFDVATSAIEFDGRPPDTMILVNGVTTWQNAAQFFGRVMRASHGVTPVVVWMLTTNSVSRKHFSKLKGYISETSGELVKIAAPAPPILSEDLVCRSLSKPHEPQSHQSVLPPDDPEARMAKMAWGLSS